MLRTEKATEIAFSDDLTPEDGREVDPLTDPETVRLVALNLELAVKNLMGSASAPECLVLTADICSYRLVARPADNGVKVQVFEL
ncbi:MAG: hypothetical protein KGY80_04230 [Candidatus Thorarchaeota archaeon]|nr:hypothetical protein [Candidatus Thorarchaeota archaeon]